MGVRGLTTFIANRSDSYLRHYKLHDTYLVIDGNSLAANLYQVNRSRNDCFGGDYDKFERTLYKFFNLLSQCKVTPLVVLDGAYEKKKIRTVRNRLRNKLKTLEHIDSVSQTQFKVFPLFLRDLFVEVVLKLQVKVVRCEFEADYELACLARALNCPVLSYDSDFFVYDVLYIPYVTLELNARPLDNKSSYYLPCQLYEMEHFLKAYGGLSKTNIPLLAVLLGNDYINKSDFKDFYATLKLVKRKTHQNAGQRSVSSVIKWLQKETYESAMIKLLSKVPLNKRRTTALLIKHVVEGYLCKKSKLLQDFNLNLCCATDEQFTIDADNILKQSENVDEDDLNDEEVESEDVEEEDLPSDDSDSPSELENDFENFDCRSIPNWFRTNFRQCRYPTAFMDIVVTHTYFCTPHLENCNNICSHLICVKIIAALNKILCSEDKIPLKVLARHQFSNLKCYQIPACNINLPTLDTLRDLNLNSSKSYFFDVVEFDYNNFISDVPDHWQLYIVAVIYWIKNSTPSVTYSHVHSLILCMLMLNAVRPKSKGKLSKQSSSQQKNSELDTLLCNITKDDCNRCQKELSKYFEMEQKMRTSDKFYDKSIVDCFAQFQSSLLHVKYLNALLNNPFVNCIISEFYNGTFLYNMCVNLQKRTNINVYMDTLLKMCPSVLTCFKMIVNELQILMSANISTTEAKRKRRKRKRSRKISQSTTDNSDVEKDNVKKEDDEAVMDENNRYSLLNFV